LPTLGEKLCQPELKVLYVVAARKLSRVEPRVIGDRRECKAENIPRAV
jgi:hypothetical protein